MSASVLETAVYTEGDGVVDWHYCRTDHAESDFSVSDTHIGLAFNPSIYSHHCYSPGPGEYPKKQAERPDRWDDLYETSPVERVRETRLTVGGSVNHFWRLAEVLGSHDQLSYCPEPFMIPGASPSQMDLLFESFSAHAKARGALPVVRR